MFKTFATTEITIGCFVNPDLDALPMEEKTNLPYASKVKTTCRSFF